MPIGDVTATFGIDDSRWIAGVVRMQNANKSMATSHAALGRSVGQVGFAVQDFASVFAMGGPNALGRAMMSTMNNVQMLGAAFSGWGLAITAVAGAIGSLLLPRLIDAFSGTEDLKKGLDRAMKSAEAWAKFKGGEAGFAFGLGGMKTSDEAKSARTAIDKELAILKAERAAMEERAALMLREEMKAGRVRLPPGFPESASIEDKARRAFAGSGYFETPEEKAAARAKESWSFWDFINPLKGAERGLEPRSPPKGSKESEEALRKFSESLQESGRAIQEAERRRRLLQQREAELPAKEKKGGASGRDLDAGELGTVENFRQIQKAISGQADEKREQVKHLGDISSKISNAITELGRIHSAIKADETPTVGIGGSA